MIAFKDVTKQYRITRERSIDVFKNVNLEIDAGEFVTIVGPSGSGKSTFLALAGLLDRPTSGEISVAGKATSQLKDQVRTNLRYDICSFVFQFASLMPSLSAIDNVMLPFLLMGEKRVNLQTKATELLYQVGLTEEQFCNLPFQLSGGEQRRVAVARALLKQPCLLFADEPTSALDEDTAKDILSLFQQLTQNGTTILMVTHDKALANQGTKLLIIKDGQLKVQG